MHDQGEYKQIIFKEKMIDHLEIESNITLIDIEDEDKNEEEDKVDDIMKNANHFAFIERATQTRIFEVLESESQTDPPPM